MKYRDVELFRELSLDDTGTKPLDLKFTDPLSAILFQFLGTNGETHNKQNWMNDVITSIELVDGSDIITSINLKESQASQFWQTKMMPHARYEEKPDGGIRDEALWLFGRYLWDSEYWLDLAKFRNPQLRITTDEDAVRDMGAEGFLSGSFKVSIVAKIIEEGAAASKGFFMNKEVYNFTADTSGDEHVELPLDYPYVGLMLHSNVRGSDINQVIEKIKISCDSDKFVPLNRYIKDIQHDLEGIYPLITQRHLYWRKDAETLQFPIYYNPHVNMNPQIVAHTALTTWCWSGNCNLALRKADGSEQTDEKSILFQVTGSSPHCTVFFPFGEILKPETYFPVEPWSEVKVILTQKAEEGVKVCLQQLRTYV